MFSVILSDLTLDGGVMFIWQEEPPGFNEREHIQDYNQAMGRYLRTASLWGLVVYDLFAIGDYFETPALFVHHTIVRLAVVTPAVLLIVWMMSVKRFVQHRRYLVLIGAFVLSMSVVYFEWNKNPEMLPRNPIGLVFVMMFGLSALRMMRREALIYALSINFAVLVLLTEANPPAQSWFSYLFVTVMASLLGLGVATLVENAWRQNFAQKKMIELREAQAAQLLEMVFPVTIAERLKAEKNSIAEYSGHVSVLFADIEGFTKISESLSPAILVADLDAIFSRIDDLCSICGCEKIKTVGDSYLAVSGVPVAAEDHAARVLRLALALRAESENLSLGGHPIKFRIGIHSGPVVAGVIGKSRFSYDLWGDTVNTASRLESTAPSASIQISDETAKLVADQFAIMPRGEVDLKGKGSRKTWLVLGTKDEKMNVRNDDSEKIAS